MKNRQYAVFGLGIFGSTIATTLAEHDREVLAIDKDETCVERITDEVTKAVIADTTNREEMLALGVDEIDVAIVAIGNHLEAAVLTTMLLKELGVPYIIAKAKNKQFQKILEKVGADKVIRPEKDMGVRIAKGLLRKNIVEMIELDEDYSIIEMQTPKHWISKTLKELDIRGQYDMNILGVREQGSSHLTINVSPDYIVQDKDSFLVIAKTDEIEEFDYLLA